jgi:hypothetical protein
MVQANPVLVVASATNPNSWKILALPISHGFGRTKQPCWWRARNAARFSARGLCMEDSPMGRQRVEDFERGWAMLTVLAEVVAFLRDIRAFHMWPLGTVCRTSRRFRCHLMSPCIQILERTVRGRAPGRRPIPATGAEWMKSSEACVRFHNNARLASYNGRVHIEILSSFKR